MAAYLHQQFLFYGVPAPQRRQLYGHIILADKTNQFLDWNLLEAAWQNPYRELDYFVCDYLRARSKELSAKDLPRLFTFLTRKKWWDTIDSFAPTLGKMAEQNKLVEQALLNWASSDDIWLRRIAIIHQLGRKEKNYTELLTEIVLKNLESREFFITKAIGWALRNYSKTKPDWVRDFIQTHKPQLAPLSMRESSRYL